MTAKALFCNGQTVVIFRNLDQFAVIRYLPGMTGQAVRGSLGDHGTDLGPSDHGAVLDRPPAMGNLNRLTVAVNAELMQRAFHSRNIQMFRIEGGAMTAGTFFRHSACLGQLRHIDLATVSIRGRVPGRFFL